MLIRHLPTRTGSLWLLFSATVALTACFPLLAGVFDLTFIDGIADPATTRATIAGFSAEQRIAHAWITGTVDVAYPLAYGVFFAASTLCFFPRAGAHLALLPLLAIPVDLFEGLVQILALTGTADWLAMKAFITPLKMLLLLCGLASTICGWLAWLYRRAKGNVS
ncbi:MAG TPA: hypothetical protein VIS76_14670 [Pseudomonadales bacterium]